MTETGAALTVASEPYQHMPIERRQGSFQVASARLQINTDERVQFKNLTAEINAFVARAGIQHGWLHIAALHTTTGIILNEIQNALLADVASLFEWLVPQDTYYQHNDERLSDCARKNADAHLRAIVAGHSLTIPIADGRLVLGQWQQILFAEFDGPNQRTLHLQEMGI